MDIGFGAKEALKDIRKDTTRITFRSDCNKFLKALFCLIRTKCPLRNKLVKGASCLSPTVMNNEKLRKQRIVIILQEFIKSKQMLSVTAELVKKNYFTFCASPITVSKLVTFN